MARVSAWLERRGDQATGLASELNDLLFSLMQHILVCGETILLSMQAYAARLKFLSLQGTAIVRSETHAYVHPYKHKCWHGHAWQLNPLVEDMTTAAIRVDGQ